MRRHYFNNSENGYFKQERPNAPNALSAMGGNTVSELILPLPL